ncbi:MAG: sialate O-acetylesterase [Alphaproteobacteria bacterium]|nr:sialate O-acetylesterase [Alphaproteobacteria bacterium]
MNRSSLLALSLALGLSGCTSGPINASWPFNSGSSEKATEVAVQVPPLLYALFQDHEVLQRDKPIHIWGTAKPADTVTVSLAGETAAATVDVDGKWEAVLPPLKAGGPYELTASSSSGQMQTNKDVLIGDVYLCSGQSNMEFPLRLASNYDADLNSASNPNIRLLHVERFSSATPRTTFGAAAEWSVTSPQTAKEFSAACYFFGRDLQPAVNVPIGLVEDAWGGSVIEAWLSDKTLQNVGGYEGELAVLHNYVTDPKAALEKWRKVTDNWWHEHDPGSAATPAWNSPAFDDSSWPTHMLAGDWEGWGVGALLNFDGTAWFRKTITLTAEQAKGAATLALGPVDDVDTTWVNGVEVGGQLGWDTPRVYTIPAGTLHEGKNLIAVGVLDLGAGGGIWGPATDKTLALADGTTIMLDTPWRYHISADIAQTGPMPSAPWLDASGLTMLYNGMITPLGHIGLKGIVWYQGESNTWEPEKYGKLLKSLIGSWRDKFGKDLPFLNVQLPNYGPHSTVPTDSQWAELREQQRLVANEVPNSGLAVTIDLGEPDFIHPTDKQDVGARLALLAEHLVYGMNVVASGPTPVTAVRKRNTVAISFAHTDSGLLAYENNRPVSFQVCDKARRCRFVDAKQNKYTIDLDVTHIRDAAMVRFCWADSPICNIYNGYDLPAVPFELPITDATRRRK